MPDVELGRPEVLDEVDHGAPLFRRRIAVAVVLVTLLGAVLAYFQAVESNREENAARDAAIFAIEGLGAQVDASSGFRADNGVFIERELLRAQEALAANRADQAPDGEAGPLPAAVERLAEMQAALADQSPLTAAEATSAAASVTAADELFAALNQQPDQDRLRQGVRAEQANGHGRKADTYVAVITVLAVALFLLGLSLTVQGRSRALLALPGVAIALVCAAWSVTIALDDVSAPSEAAIRRTAEAGRALAAGRPDDAIAILDEVIADEPDYAAARARRGEAHFLAGSPQADRTGFISVTDPQALDRAVEDLEAAVANGGDSDLTTLADLGFFTFLQGDFERSVDLTEQAVDQNDQLAQVFYNLGVSYVGLGDERQAAVAYRAGTRLLETEPQAFLRDQIVAGARTDLRIVRDLVDSDDADDVEELARRFEADLADLQLQVGPCAAAAEGGGCPDVDEDLEATDIILARAGRFVEATYAVAGLEPGTPVAAVYYFRPEGGDTFETSSGLTDVRPVEDPTSGLAVGQAGDCPAAGDYEVELWGPGGILLGTASTTIEAGPLGDEFELVVDGPEGFTLCVPAGFDREVGEAEADGQTDDFGSFESLERDLTVGINVIPGAVQEGSQEDALTGFVDLQVPGVDVPLEDVTIEAEQVGGGVVTLEAVSASFTLSDGTATTAILSIGDDGVFRFIDILGSDDPAVRDEVLALLRFTGLPADP
ncbi:MAG: tetratricopeptide repeat protein [Acidimicrobiales bacterium]